MSSLKINSLEDNPLIINNPKLERLEASYSSFLELLKKYLQNHELTEELKAKIKESIVNAYLEKKAEIYLEIKISNISKNIQSMISSSFDKTFEKNQNNSNLIYYNKKNSLVTHEQY